jgi:hypothetical protein
VYELHNVSYKRGRQAGVLAALVLAGTVLFACIEITRRPDIEITPEAVPEELRGANWPDLPVHYCIVRDDQGFAAYEDFARLTEEAFRAWGIPAVNDGVCAGAAQQGNRRNEIGWGLSPQQTAGVHEAGYTRLLFQRCTFGCAGEDGAEIVEADIMIAPDPPRRLASLDCLRTTLLHETGHFLGVQHQPSPAVMAPISFSCPQELTDVDRAAIETLYPE